MADTKTNGKNHVEEEEAEDVSREFFFKFEIFFTLEKNFHSFSELIGRNSTKKQITFKLCEKFKKLFFWL